MNAKFVDIHQAADLLGPGAIEVPLYQAEIHDQVLRRGFFGRRIRQVPATGHPSRYFVEGQEHSVALKAITAQINYNLFDLGQGEQKSQYAYLQTRDVADTVEGVLRAHDVALWNGKDTSFHAPTSPEYFGVAAQIAAAGEAWRVETHENLYDALRLPWLSMLANGHAPTALYANPVLLDLVDRDLKSAYGAVLSTKEIAPGFTVKVLKSSTAELPLIPEWTLPYTGTPGTGSAVLPAYIVTEDLIEYHWLSDPNPRIFQLGVPGSLASQYVVVKFGGLVVKHPGTAHCQVLVER